VSQEVTPVTGKPWHIGLYRTKGKNRKRSQFDRRVPHNERERAVHEHYRSRP